MFESGPGVLRSEAQSHAHLSECPTQSGTHDTQGGPQTVRLPPVQQMIHALASSQQPSDAFG